MLMRPLIFFGTVIFFSLLLVACATKRNPNADGDLTRETWRSLVVTGAKGWDKGADHWFFTAEPNGTEVANRTAPISDSISTMTVRAGSFTTIKANGAFQVQIFGTDEGDPNSIYVNGPNTGIQAIAIEQQGNTLYVRQTQEIPVNIMRRMIVRIGVHQLNQLVQMGSGTVEVIRIQSQSLSIKSIGSGNVYVVGRINLKRVTQNGSGSINVFNVNTPNLIIETTGSGAVNIAGRVGIRSIVHHGQSDINIVGADSDLLDIYADGSGKIGIDGKVNVRSVDARDTTCVYVLQARSDCIEVNVAGHASVGIAGMTNDLYVTTQDATFFGGQYLCAQNAYVTATGHSHINVTASNRIFASASQQSSIYFFGPSALLDKYSSGDGAILPIGGRNWCNYDSEFRAYSYTYARKGETILHSYAGDRGAKQSGTHYRHRHAVPASQYIK